MLMVFVGDVQIRIVKIIHREESIFCGFKSSFITILKILIRYFIDQQNSSINKFVYCDMGVISKVVNKLIDGMPGHYFIENKLGEVGKFVQVDETMLNF
ncbi:hypothetical protein H311_03771 [Anncaliia algerae PRA109]|nr:hypothetical protein H311_03771 [Anncaliia algerae PRA109]